MAANISPIYSRIADVQWGAADGDGGTAGALKTANTAKDGTGTVLTIFTADNTNAAGGRVEGIVVRAVGTNVQTVLRIFVNNGSTNATVANNTLIGELTCPATTLSETTALADVLLYGKPFPLALPPLYKLMVTIGTTIAAGIRVSAVGGKY